MSRIQTIHAPTPPPFPLSFPGSSTGVPVNNSGGPRNLPGTVASGGSTTPLKAVAVIDTGIDSNHPELNVTFSTAFGGLPDGQDQAGHGTHVSGTIGAVGNNATGVAGVNWTASIMGAKFLDASGSGSIANAINAIEFVLQAKAAFAAGGGANVRVLSNSWGGGGYSQAMFDEIAKAGANGMLFVAAAGNSATNNDVTAFYPADYAV